MKYKGCITYDSKAMANVKVFVDKQTDGQADRPNTVCPRSINAGT